MFSFTLSSTLKPLIMADKKQLWKTTNDKKMFKSNLKNLCVFTFVIRSVLELHKNRHAGKKPHACTHCGKTFLAKAGLERHVAAMHSDATPYKCDECGKEFRVKDNIKKHMKIHQEPKHVCSVSCLE